MIGDEDDALGHATPREIEQIGVGRTRFGDPTEVGEAGAREGSSGTVTCHARKHMA
jgi:hypothetical protein